MAEFYTSERRDFAGLGEVTNVNQEGLSALYMADKMMASTNIAEVVIVRYDMDGRVALNTIPCSLTSDVQVMKTSTGTLLGLCGVRFEEPLPLQATLN
jgi:hypothetical protein